MAARAKHMWNKFDLRKKTYEPRSKFIHIKSAGYVYHARSVCENICEPCATHMRNKCETIRLDCDICMPYIRLCLPIYSIFVGGKIRPYFTQTTKNGLYVKKKNQKHKQNAHDNANTFCYVYVCNYVCAFGFWVTCILIYICQIYIYNTNTY